ncbi:hypothetical protein U1Q18_028011, partial [Sarracenia purpurea var. burkii]
TSQEETTYGEASEDMQASRLAAWENDKSSIRPAINPWPHQTEATQQYPHQTKAPVFFPF